MSEITDTTPAQGYEDYFEPAIFQPLAHLLLEHAPPPAGARVLDLACGTGVVAHQVAPMVGPQGHVLGVDANPAMVAVARAKPNPVGAPIEWRVGDAVALELPDDSIDMVICQQGLQFFADRQAATRQMVRVLTGSGRVAIAVWQGLDHHPLYAAMAEAEAPHLLEAGLPVTLDDLTAPFSLGDAAELHGLLSDAGFDGIEIVARSIEARFSDPDRFVERMEHAYAGVVPQFAADPVAFAAYLEAIAAETKPIVEVYRRGEEIVVPMHSHIAVAHA